MTIGCNRVGATHAAAAPTPWGRGMAVGDGLAMEPWAGRARYWHWACQTPKINNRQAAHEDAHILANFDVVLVSSMGFVFMSRDRADENNRVMAALDPLTGVANRRSLIAALDRDVARSVRTRESIALMMVDIDHFKVVNDLYGHPVGDKVLCSVVNVLSQRVRAQDLGPVWRRGVMVVRPDTVLVGRATGRELSGVEGRAAG